MQTMTIAKALLLLGSAVLAAGCSQVRAPVASSPGQQAAALLAAQPAMARTLSAALQRWHAQGQPDALRWARIPGSEYRIDLASVQQSRQGVAAWSRGRVAEGQFSSQPLARTLASHERYDCAGNMQPLDGVLYDAQGRQLSRWTPPAVQELVRIGSLGRAKEQFLCE